VKRLRGLAAEDAAFLALAGLVLAVVAALALALLA
jgi:hypothetical protein